MEVVVSVGKSGRIFLPKKVIQIMSIDEGDLLVIDIKDIGKAMKK